LFYVNFALLAVYTGFTFWFAMSSFKEKTFRAGFLALFLSLIMGVGLSLYARAWVAGLLTGFWINAIQDATCAGLVVFTLLMFAPLGRNPKALAGTAGMAEGEPEKFNQKNTAFNVAHVGGYGPEVGKKRWSLQSRDIFGGIYWTLVMGLRHQVDGKVNPKKVKTESAPERMTKRIKNMARYAGADMVGVTRVKDDFVYSEAFSYEASKLETGPAVTTPIEMKHKFAIVMAKEMRFDKVQATLTEKNEENLAEVGKTYYEIAQVACAVASSIRQMGFSARAHHLRNEQIFHIPHAVNAGLGEQGRFNYLITPLFGPRVRLATVTTDLELVEDRPLDIGVQDFCVNCRLCEINCPAGAIGSEKELVRGYWKWKQNYEKCFQFWVSGDNTFACTLCMKICPWNKPRSFVHRVSFFAARRSRLARRVLYWITVIFYGKRTLVKRIPLKEEAEMPPETQTWGR
jgi:reductive dehalogenase